MLGVLCQCVRYVCLKGEVDLFLPPGVQWWVGCLLKLGDSLSLGYGTVCKWYQSCRGDVLPFEVDEFMRDMQYCVAGDWPFLR
jgi:hypothetical protein